MLQKSDISIKFSTIYSMFTLIMLNRSVCSSQDREGELRLVDEEGHLKTENVDECYYILEPPLLILKKSLGVFPNSLNMKLSNWRSHVKP